MPQTGSTAAGGTSTDDDIGDKVGLGIGSIVESKRFTYEIVKVLGEGGFGAVYMVRDVKNRDKAFAMKVEPRQARKHNKLKMEIDILTRVGNERKISHFAHIVDRGKQEELYVFVVMYLVGESLADLRDRSVGRIFPIATGLGVGRQSLEAVEDLQKHGFIHRDIKPANFSCGREPNRHVIYILDFGIARKITKDDDVLKTPRGFVNFKGTVRYAAIRCHLNLDMSYSDDVESWLYMILDLTMVGGVPWRRIEDKKRVLEMKQACRKEKRSLVAKNFACQEHILSIQDYIAKLGYQNPVDYPFIYLLLQRCAEVSKVDMDAPFFWESQPPPKSDS